MIKELVNSRIDRQNVLNNQFAVEEIRKAVGLHGIFFKGEYWVTRSQLADFFEVSERTIVNCTNKNIDELVQNGYVVLRGKLLKDFELCSKNDFVDENNFTHKIRNLSVYNFRSFLNVGMLLSKSEKAKQLRSLILDIVIDTINQRTGGSTKYINQRDDTFLASLLANVDYHKHFVDALTNYVDMGRIKYAIYTNKIYRSIFREDADEYRKVLRLETEENERDTMYSEVLDLIAAYENGFAEDLKKYSERANRKLFSFEVDRLFGLFEKQALWEPLREQARRKMASRDMCFRDAVHTNLQRYIDSVSPDDFARFIGDKSLPINERIEAYEDALKRLKNRD